MDDDVAMHQLQDKDGPTQPAKITVNKFFTAVPRTAILENEGPDAGPVIKKDTAAPPVNLGEISAGGSKAVPGHNRVWHKSASSGFALIFLTNWPCGQCCTNCLLLRQEWGSH